MSTIDQIVATLRGEYIDEVNKHAAKEIAEENQKREDATAYIDRMIVQPWRAAAAAAGVPKEIAELATVEISEYLNLTDPLCGVGNDWRHLVLRIPGCHPIYIFPAGGTPARIDSKNLAEPPDEWRLHVSRPEKMAKDEFWDEETGSEAGPFYLIRSWPERGYHSYGGIGSLPQIGDWRIVVGSAATSTPAEMDLMAECEHRNTTALVDSRRQRDEAERDPKHKPLSFFDIATDDARPDNERKIAAVLHLAERIDAITDRIGGGIMTYPAEY